MRTLVVPKGAAAGLVALDGVLEVPGKIPELLAFLMKHGVLRIPDDRLIDVVVPIDCASKSGRFAQPFLPLLEQVFHGGNRTARSLAAGLIGRHYLHAGATSAAQSWLDRERGLASLDYLPESPIKEYVLFERHAVRSIAAIDHGELDDEREEHRKVDELIDDLAGRTISRHEEFMRFALLNSRARRLDYLGRLHADPKRLDRAWSDLMALRDRWPAIVDFATNRLGRGDTTIERIENQCIDLLQARHALATAGLSGGAVPAAWLDVARGFSPSSRPVTGLQSFDLLGWLKLRSVLDGGVDAADLRAAAATLGVLGMCDAVAGGGGNGASVGEVGGTPLALEYPDFVSLEWLLRMDREHALPTDRLAAVLERTISTRTAGDGVFRILALRSAAVLQLHGRRTDALRLVPDSSVCSLRGIRADVVGDGEPAHIVRRCPY